MPIEPTVPSEQSRTAAFQKILKVTSTKSARYVTWAAAALGMAALIPGLQLPAALGMIAGGIGIEAMGSLIDHVAYNDQLSEEEIVKGVKKAIAESGMDETLRKDDFYQAFAHLRKGQRSLSKQNQAIYALLCRLESVFDDDFAAVAGGRKDWQERYKSWLESLLTLNPFPLLSPLMGEDKALIGRNGIYVSCKLRVDPIQSLESFDEDFAAIDPLEQSWDAVPRFRQRFQRVTFDWVLQHRSPVVILGGAGSGKTTMLKAEALRMLHGASYPLPLYVECRELLPFLLQDKKTGIWEYLEEHQGLPSNHSFEDSLINGDIVVFVDGLDEIGGETVEESVNRLHTTWTLLEYLFKTYNQCKWVVSTRYLGITSLHRRFANYSCFEICPLEPKDISLFAEKWFRSSELRERFIQQVGIPQLKNLATNPLLITFMAILVQNGRSLPKSRTRLYQGVVNLLVSEWDERRGIERPRNQDLTKEMTVEFLADTALRIQEKQSRYITRSETIEYVSEFFGPLIQDFQVESLLAEISTYGIFRETARDWFGFLHRTFQEYFAALALRDSVDKLLLHRHEIWWREVLTLAGEMIPPDEWLTALLRKREDVFHSNLLLAGRCVATIEAPTSVIEKWTIARLASLLEESPYEAVCSEAVEILAQIGTEETLQILSNVVRKAGRPFLRRMAAYRLQSTRWEDFPVIASELSRHILTHITTMSSEEDEAKHLIRLFGCITHFSLNCSYTQIVDILRNENINQRVRAWLAEAVGDTVAESLGKEVIELLLDRRIPKSVRQVLAQHISSIQHLTSEEEIVRLLENEALDEGILIFILLTLRSFESPALSEALIELLPQVRRKPKEHSKPFIALILGDHPETHVIRKLEDLCHSPDVSPQVKESLKYPLWKYGIESLPNLLELLSRSSLNSLVKVNIAREIETAIPPEMLPRVLEYVFDETCDAGVRKILLEVLERYGDSRVAFELIKIVPNENYGEPARKKVADVIGTLGGPQHIEMLLNCAMDGSLNASIRWRLFIAIARIIRRLPQQQRDAIAQEILREISPLLAPEALESNLYVLRGVILSLGQMGSSLTVNPLKELLLKDILPQEAFHALKENAQLVGQTVWPEDLGKTPTIYQV